MKNRWKLAAIAIVLAGMLGGCASSTHLASSGAVDDLYTSHDRRAIAQAELKQVEYQRQLQEQRALRDIEAAGNGGYYSESILSTSYEDSYERRLRGFQSLTYKLPSSYYDFYYSDAAWEASAYDPAFYNVIVMGDEVWVEPRYVTSMFGNWGTTVNVNLGWGWNSWYRPYWDWYGPGWAWNRPWYWNSYWGWGGGYYGGWGYSWHWDPWYHYPHYGWGGGHYHNNWGWGGSSGNGRYTLSSSNRRGSGTLGTSTPGRYNNSVGTSTSSTARRGSSSGSGVNYDPGLNSSGSTYRRGTTSSASSGAGTSTGTGSGSSTYRRGTTTSGNTSGTTSSGSSSSSSSTYRRGVGTSTGSGTTSSSSSGSSSTVRRSTGTSSSGTSSSGSSGTTSRSSGSYSSGSSSSSSSGASRSSSSGSSSSGSSSRSSSGSSSSSGRR